MQCVTVDQRGFMAAKTLCVTTKLIRRNVNSSGNIALINVKYHTYSRIT